MEIDCKSCGKSLVGDEKSKELALCDCCYQAVLDASHAQERRERSITKTGIMGTLLGVSAVLWLAVFVVDGLVGAAIVAVGAPLLVGYCFSLAVVSIFECWKGRIAKTTATGWLVVAGAVYHFLYHFHINFR